MGDSREKFLQYLEVEKKYSSLTLISYRRDLQDFEEFLSKTEDISIDEAKRLHIRNFIAYSSEIDKSARTINRKISALRSFYKFLIKIRRIEINPAISINTLKTVKNVIIPYSEEEILQLDNYLKNLDIHRNKPLWKILRDRLVLNVFYQTGIRRMELIMITWDKIDLNSLLINIIGKQNKERQIPIHRVLGERIKEYRKELLNNGLLNEYLFCDNKGEKLKEKFVYNLINNYLSIVSEKDKKSPHMLRHTFATHLLNNGAEINSIKELLGHTGLSATQVYMHETIESLKKVVNRSHPDGDKK